VYGFVEFNSSRDAEAAFEALNRTQIDRSAIQCQFVEPREQTRTRRDYEPAKPAVPLPAPLLAPAPINPLTEVTRYNTDVGEFTLDSTGRLTRREHLEEEQRTGRARSPVPPNPLLIQSAMAIAQTETVIPVIEKTGVMLYVKHHPRLVINYSDI
jgi:hypothetical protein